MTMHALPTNDTGPQDITQHQSHHQAITQPITTASNPHPSQSLEQIKEESMMDNLMFDMDVQGGTLEYFAQMQLQSPLLNSQTPNLLNTQSSNYLVQQPGQQQQQHQSSQIAITRAMEPAVLASQQSSFSPVPFTMAGSPLSNPSLCTPTSSATTPLSSPAQAQSAFPAYDNSAHKQQQQQQHLYSTQSLFSHQSSPLPGTPSIPVQSSGYTQQQQLSHPSPGQPQQAAGLVQGQESYRIKNHPLFYSPSPSPGVQETPQQQSSMESSTNASNFPDNLTVGDQSASITATRTSDANAMGSLVTTQTDPSASMFAHDAPTLFSNVLQANSSAVGTLPNHTLVDQESLQLLLQSQQQHQQQSVIGQDSNATLPLQDDIGNTGQKSLSWAMNAMQTNGSLAGGGQQPSISIQQQQQQQQQAVFQHQQPQAQHGSCLPFQMPPQPQPQPQPQQHHQHSLSQHASPPTTELTMGGGMAGLPTGHLMSAPLSPPTATRPRHRLLHSQSQPGLRRYLQQQQQQQQQQVEPVVLSSQPIHGVRRRQHSFHLPGESPYSFGMASMEAFHSAPLPTLHQDMCEDQSQQQPLSLTTTRHLSLPAGSLTGGLSIQSGMIGLDANAVMSTLGYPSPSSFGMVDETQAAAGGLAMTLATLSNNVHSTMTSYPFQSSTTPSTTSTPLSTSASTSPNSTSSGVVSRSRKGSKSSKSRPNSVSGSRMAGAPYSPPSSIASPPSSLSGSSSGGGHGSAHSRSPSIVPVSPNLNTSEILLDPVEVANAVAGLTNHGLPTDLSSLTAHRELVTKANIKNVIKNRVRSRSGSMSMAAAAAAAALGSNVTPTTSASSSTVPTPSSSSLLSVDEQVALLLVEEENRCNGGLLSGDLIDSGDFMSTTDGGSSGAGSMATIKEEDKEMSAEDDELSNVLAGLMDSTMTTSSSGSLTTTTSNPTGGPIPCPIPSCNKTFARTFNLKAHIKNHEVQKPFACHMCTRVFSRKHDLQRHIRVHTGSKPYVCVNCEKAFARTDALCRHYKVEEACRVAMQAKQAQIKEQKAANKAAAAAAAAAATSTSASASTAKNDSAMSSTATKTTDTSLTGSTTSAPLSTEANMSLMTDITTTVLPSI
ncbi:hypothetical protein BGW42_006293 [Actinomortierella wolfii]|nr:hypothetical protein BGW42_006293 [Actinomortierella wolfii]